MNVSTALPLSNFLLQLFFLLQLTFMGINRTEVEETDDSEDAPADFLPSHAWQKMGEEALKYFRRAPTFHYM